jgi:hypothetical protein
MSSSQPNRRKRGDTCRQSPKLRAIIGGQDLDAFEDGRMQAALANVVGYEAALAALHPDDTVARAWYRSRLSDCRVIAHMAPLPHLVAVDNDKGIAPQGER